MKRLIIALLLVLAFSGSAIAQDINCSLLQKDGGMTKEAVDFFRANACSP